MKKIVIASLCALALSATAAAAQPEHHRHHQTAPDTYNNNFGIPGNPYAGGGPAGSAEATDSPDASNVIGN